MGTVHLIRAEAVELLRSLQGGSPQSALARAIGERGRIPKTLHLLAVYDDEAYRRLVTRSLVEGLYSGGGLGAQLAVDWGATHDDRTGIRRTVEQWGARLGAVRGAALPTALPSGA